MYRKLNDTITLDFTIHLPTTGAVSDADALPTVEVFEDATDSTLAGATVTKRVGKTGNYRVEIVATTGNGFEVGKSYNVVVTAIAGTVTAKAVIGSFFIDGKRLSDLNDLGGTAQTGDNFALIGSGGSGLTALGDTRLNNLDDTISSRSTATQGATKAELDAAEAAIILATPSLSAVAIEANIEGHVTNAINAYDPPTKGELDTAESNIITAMPDISLLATEDDGRLETMDTRIDEIYKLFGLEPGSPLLVTLTSRTAGGISQTISIDSVNKRTTVTRI